MQLNVFKLWFCNELLDFFLLFLVGLFFFLLTPTPNFEIISGIIEKLWSSRNGGERSRCEQIKHAGERIFMTSKAVAAGSSA